MNPKHFDGKIMEILINFSGNFIEVKPSQKTIFNERYVGQMLEIEKTFFTLRELKKEEGKKLTKTILGITSDIEEYDPELIVSGLTEKATDNDLDELNRLYNESQSLHKILVGFIGFRIPSVNKAPIVIFKPEWKIFVGIPVH